MAFLQIIVTAVRDSTDLYYFIDGESLHQLINKVDMIANNVRINLYILITKIITSYTRLTL